MKHISNTSAKIDYHFPFDSFREGQKEAIQSFIEAYQKGKHHVIFEGPCGSGKSVIAYTLAQFFDRVFWVCPQKFLQDQIIQDFEALGATIDLKGRTNYPCTFWDTVHNKLPDEDAKKVLYRAQKEPEATWVVQHADIKMDCSKGICRIRDDATACSECFPQGYEKQGGYVAPSHCPYWSRLREAQQAQICLMNFKSFLFQTSISERFPKRDLLIIDECHGIESEILDFVSLTIKDMPFKHRGISIPRLETISDYKKLFYEEKLPEVLEEMATIAKYQGNFREEDEWLDLRRKILNFLMKATDDTWVFDHTKRGPFNKIQFKPIFVDDFAPSLLFKHATYTLMMSATVLSPKHIFEALGLGQDDVYTYRMKNRFPVKNRPIYFMPSGSMNYRSKKATYPKLIKDIDDILAAYPNDRGMVHTHNFEIAELLVDNCSNSSRMLFQKRYKTKKAMLEEHRKNTNSVIVAPAMHEGLDLKNDLARFQIIAKVPYPNFHENEQMKMRMNLDDMYYLWLTALKLAQSTGRVVRSETDYADTYIMDEEFRRFFNRSKKFLPKWMKEAVKWD